MFDRAEDANSYLRNTVCYWDGQPVYVDGVGHDFRAILYDIPTFLGKMRTEDVRDPRFNCHTYRLGYMNYTRDNKSYRVSRSPARQIQQGLCDNNTVILAGLRGEGDVISVQRAIRDQGFADMLLGVYPTMGQVRERLADKATISVAVSPVLTVKRHSQFSNLHFLEYKGADVSFSETLEFVLPNEFEYLREVCMPTGVLKAAQ